MFLTTKGRYAVMVMVELAHDASDEPISSQALSSRLGIDAVYLDQILAKLRASKMINATRGPGGGYKLACSSSDIKVFDIMIAADEPLKMTKCVAEHGDGCLNKDKKAICNTHHFWTDLEEQIADFLKARTLESLCGYNNKEEGDDHGYRIFRL